MVARRVIINTRFSSNSKLFGGKPDVTVVRICMKRGREVIV
jgi:hypothetical protein